MALLALSSLASTVFSALGSMASKPVQRVSMAFTLQVAVAFKLES